MTRKRYLLNAQITISLNATVWARSKTEALKKARDLDLPGIQETEQYPDDDDGDDYETWRTSGELDGMPVKVTCERDE